MYDGNQISPKTIVICIKNMVADGFSLKNIFEVMPSRTLEYFLLQKKNKVETHTKEPRVFLGILDGFLSHGLVF